MWFNLVTENHSKRVAIYQLGPLVRAIRNTLGACGHEVTVVTDQMYPGAINLCLENFSHTHAEQYRYFRHKHGLKIGVIATELMLGGTIPYAAQGVNIVGADEHTKEGMIRQRVANFESAIKEVDFLWCVLPRTAEEYRGRCVLTEFFPLGFTRDIPLSERRAPKDVDVFFFGRATPHRTAVLNGLTQSGLQVVAAGGGTPMGWLPEFMVESVLDRAKIGLNLTLHAVGESADGRDPRFVSCLRAIDMLERRTCVVSEEIPLDNPYAPFMISSPVDEIVMRCRDLVRSGDWERFGEEAAGRFRRDMNARDVCGPVIERTLSAISSRSERMARPG